MLQYKKDALIKRRQKAIDHIITYGCRCYTAGDHIQLSNKLETIQDICIELTKEGISLNTDIDLVEIAQRMAGGKRIVIN